MSILEQSLARRSVEERSAFWHAVDLYYASRKAPPEAVPATKLGASMPVDLAIAARPCT
ncbi:hypothetical protein [Methylobacterium sp. NEAU K]|uniref:hypothetical protein n=1 Tax=Methylobacterium sp. NEAU K TaxID=3064946 RepID=UPI002735E28B|nr:hypothetical protein [Methylobacterium sp. NEAU K]MDP4005022.1 hypothetical protein [Methylobacterium sp. NEAU K]